MTEVQSDEGAHLDLPRTNPVPLIVAAVVAIVLLAGIVAVLAGGSDDDDPTADAPDESFVFEGNASLPADNTDVSTAPDVTFTYFDDTTGTLDDFAGKPVVVNFFASWCAPCIAEMPDLQTVSEEYGDEVQFVGLNVQDAVPDGERIVEDTGVEYIVARDPDGGVLESFGGLAMPTTVFIDADGNVVRLHSGKITADNLRQIIDQDLLA